MCWSQLKKSHMATLRKNKQHGNWRFPKIWVPPSHHPFFHRDFPWNKPSSYRGSPYFRKPPIEHSQLIFPLQNGDSAWRIIPLSKWVISPLITGISKVNPLPTGVITHLVSGMNHQVQMDFPAKVLPSSLRIYWAPFNFFACCGWFWRGALDGTGNRRYFWIPMGSIREFMAHGLNPPFWTFWGWFVWKWATV